MKSMQALLLVASFVFAWQLDLLPVPPKSPAAVATWSPELAVPTHNEAEAAIEPRIDRVWHAIPGLDGIDSAGRAVKPKRSLGSLGAEPIYRGNERKPAVALMINVAWGNEYIAPMLATLARHDVRATFFLDGTWLTHNAELARQIQASGHELANHAYSHPKMSQLSDTSQREQIARTQQLLASELGISDNRWFAPPSGDYNQRTVEIARSQGLFTVLWTLDTVDWKHPAPSSIVRKVEQKVGAGSLILMHPTDSASGALDGIITVIKQHHLKPTTVSDTLSSARIDIAP